MWRHLNQPHTLNTLVTCYRKHHLVQNLSLRHLSIFRTICTSSQIPSIFQQGILNFLLLFLSPADVISIKKTNRIYSEQFTDYQPTEHWAVFKIVRLCISHKLVVHFEFLSEGQMANRESLQKVTSCNEITHESFTITMLSQSCEFPRFVPKIKWLFLKPPYSPDLTPCDFFLFLKLK